MHNHQSYPNITTVIQSYRYIILLSIIVPSRPPGIGGQLAVESVGISVWWSDFSILQAVCKETQPDNLLAKYIWNNFTRHLQIFEVKKKKKR